MEAVYGTHPIGGGGGVAGPGAYIYIYICIILYIYIYIVYYIFHGIGEFGEGRLVTFGIWPQNLESLRIRAGSTGHGRKSRAVQNSHRRTSGPRNPLVFLTVCDLKPI